jgi:hypothetical protein
MTAFIKTRAATDYICRHAPSDLARNRALALLTRLDTCEAALASGNGEAPAFAGGLLRSLVLLVRELAGPAWLAASAGDPGIDAFTALDTTPDPPAPDILDEIFSRVLWARFGPGHRGRKGPAAGTGTPPGQPATPGLATPGLATPREDSGDQGTGRRAL